MMTVMLGLQADKSYFLRLFNVCQWKNTNEYE